MFASFFNRFSSFTYLNITQFLGALNDNIYKLLVIFFLIEIEGADKNHQILALTGAIFVMPFLLFSAFSGILADRYSKRDIIVTTKILELVIMGLAVLAFAYQSRWGAYTVLFLLATQSALFGPSKYGIVPEIVESDRIPNANGLMTSCTFFAIILGSFLGSFLMQVTGKNFVVASIICTFFSLVGVVTSFLIEFTPASGSSKKMQAFFINDIYQTLKLAHNEVALLPSIVGAAFFLFVGAFVQMNIIPFAMSSLYFTDVEAGYLFFLTALGIGVGALIAGKISGRIVELGLVPIGVLGIGVASFMLDSFSTNLWVVLSLVTILGAFGGLYEIPLDSYVQVTSPRQLRGQMVAASNFLGFVGVLCASALIYLNTEVFGIEPEQGFILIGFFCMCVMVFFTYQFFDYLTRFISAILAKLHFRVTFEGKENIPDCPAVYVCTHRAWNDTLLIMSSQRRRMRFFIENEQHHSKWFKRLYRLLRVVFIPDLEPLDQNPEYLEAIQNTLKKGISVCIFIKSWDLESEIEKLHQTDIFKDIIHKAQYPIIPVRIQKSYKKPRSNFLRRFIRKFYVPATVTFGQIVYQGEEENLKMPHELEFCFDA